METTAVKDLNFGGRIETNKALHVPKILIVEDDITLEPIWSYIIERVNRKASVVWATAEAEAEELIMDSFEKGHEYDLVITDIFLSGSKTGIDLWNRFFHLLHGRIIVTSSIEYSKFAKYLGTTAAQPLYLQKPLSPHDCIEAVYGMLQRSNRL